MLLLKHKISFIFGRYLKYVLCLFLYTNMTTFGYYLSLYFGFSMSQINIIIGIVVLVSNYFTMISVK